MNRNLYPSGRARYEDSLLMKNKGLALDAVGTLSPRTVLNLRAGFNRFEWTNYIPDTDTASLGFPAELMRQLQRPGKYPFVTVAGYFAGGGVGRDVEAIDLSENYTAQATVMSILGSHATKYGFEFRVRHHMPANLNLAAGAYDFGRGWTGPTPQVEDPLSGHPVASLLLGTMQSGSATIYPALYNRWHYPVLFFQDDWRVNSRLSLALGLRWDWETPPVERFDRQNRGFDTTARSPYSVPGLELRGGLLFAGTGGQPRQGYDPDRDNWQPRLGVSYKLLKSKPLVFRGGMGRYFLPTVSTTGGDLGFSQTTQAIVSTADFRQAAVISNPFPGGLIRPAGATAGLGTGVGGAVSFTNPAMRIPYVWQFTAGFQYQIPGGILLDASYSGSRTRELTVTRPLSYLTVEQLAMGTPYLNQTLPNPFFGVLPANTVRGAQATIQRRALLVAYPQFSGVSQEGINLGESWYNSLQIRAEKRMKHGFSGLLSYTASKTMEAVGFLNAQDVKASRELTSFDVPQRLVVSGVYELPAGAGKKWLKRNWANHVFGGWQVSGILIAQSGVPIAYPNYLLNGNPKLETGQSFSRWFDTSPSIWVQRPADTLRVTPLRSPNIRRHTGPQLDATLQRSFRLSENHRLQLRLNAYNFTNTPIFGGPNTTPSSALFGIVTMTQTNPPRSMEIGVRYVF